MHSYLQNALESDDPQEFLPYFSDDSLRGIINILASKNEEKWHSVPLIEVRAAPKAHISLISGKLRLTGGHHFRNYFRGEGPLYHDIVNDVCSNVGADGYKNRTVVDAEQIFINTLFRKVWNKLSEEKRAEILRSANLPEGLSSLKAEDIVGRIPEDAFRFFVGSVCLLAIGVGAAAAEALLLAGGAMAFGPIGIAAAGAIAIVTGVNWLCEPSYRKLMPAIVAISVARQKLLMDRVVSSAL